MVLVQSLLGGLGLLALVIASAIHAPVAALESRGIRRVLAVVIVYVILLGVIGSFVGGFIGYLIFHKDASGGFLQPAGIIGSIIGAIIVLLIWTRMGARRTSRV